MNDFKDVYYSSKEAMEKFGEQFYTELNNSSKEERDKNLNKKLNDLLEDGNITGAI